MDVDMEGSIAVKTFNKSKIEFQKEIGSGSFGKVFKAILKDQKVQVAVKIFYQEFIGILPNVDSNLRATAYDELAKVAVLDHENIVRLLGMVEDDIPWLVFEYMKDGNLLEHVMRKKDIKERTLTRFCRDICNGMAFLHRNNFLHKDLAARNILLDGKTAKIADLGLCSFLTEDHHGAYALGGKLFPYRHAASECIVECIFTYESDVWSFGVLLFEIFSGGSVPYGSENKQPEVRRFIADGMNPTNFQEPTCSDNIVTVMKGIFEAKREERPTFTDLLQYFETLLSTRGLKLPRPIRESSPFRNIKHHHQRVQELTASSDKLSSSPPTSTYLGTPPTSSGSFPSNPDLSSIGRSHHNNGHSQSHHSHTQPLSIHQQNHHHLNQNHLLDVSPPNSYGERRYSEIPGLNAANARRSRQDFLSVDSKEERGTSPRRAASFNNISKPEAYRQSAKVEQRHNPIFKDFVPNRFGGNKKQFGQE